MFAAPLDQRASLVPVQTGHHNIDKNEIWLMIGYFRKRIEAVFSQDDLASGLHQKNFSAPTDSVAIVDYHHPGT